MSYQTIISASDLYDALSNPDWVIFDCRSELRSPDAGLAAYIGGHIPGAYHVNLDTDLSSAITESSGRHPLPDADIFCQKLRGCGVNNSTQIIAYDDKGGAFASRLWWLMRWLGHDDVAVLDGGIQAWEAHGFELSQGQSPVPRAGDFKGVPDDNAILDADAVASRLDRKEICLVDARTHDRFTAKDVTTDPVPGHVPGAQSFPFSGNLTEDGFFKSPGELKKRYGGIERSCVSMCGSGVTGCHNMLAMAIAGLPIGQLYVGSWSEWIRDDKRPVATGEADMI